MQEVSKAPENVSGFYMIDSLAGRSLYRTMWRILPACILLRNAHACWAGDGLVAVPDGPAEDVMLMKYPAGSKSGGARKSWQNKHRRAFKEDPDIVIRGDTARDEKEVSSLTRQASII